MCLSASVRTCLSASVRSCLSASEFSVYFYYYYIWYTSSSKLSFVDILRQRACQLLNSLSTFTIITYGTLVAQSLLLLTF
jgi:hypothetical protein